MAYGDFDLRKATTDFGLVCEQDTDLFADVPPVPPGDELRQWLDRFAVLALGLGSDQARAVYLLGPIFAEVMRRAESPVLVFAGVPLEVDKARGLTGTCDYLMTRAKELYYLRGPMFVAVAATRDEIGGGLGRCAAQMVAVRMFNEKDKTPLPTVYGCVTSGNNWRFLKLEGDTLTIDRTEYHIQNIAAVLGILADIAASAPAV